MTGIRRVTVFGSSSITPESAEYEQAMRLGRLLAEAGFEVVNGGQKGSMEAVARGVSEAGGRCVGITVRDAPWGQPTGWAAEIVRHDDLLMRMRALLIGSDAWIALPGQIGTLAEVMAGWVLLSSRLIAARHLILVGPRWKRAIAQIRQELEIADHYESFLAFVDSAEQVIEKLGTKKN